MELSVETDHMVVGLSVDSGINSSSPLVRHFSRTISLPIQSRYSLSAMTFYLRVMALSVLPCLVRWVITDMDVLDVGDAYD